MLRATGRHPWRAAHIHLLVTADGYRPLTTEVFDGDSEYLVYTGFLGMLLGSILVAGAGRWLLILPATLLLLTRKLKAEEKLLCHQFPEQYQSYRDQVPRLIPRLRTLVSGRNPAVQDPVAAALPCTQPELTATSPSLRRSSLSSEHRPGGKLTSSTADMT